MAAKRGPGKGPYFLFRAPDLSRFSILGHFRAPWATKGRRVRQGLIPLMTLMEQVDVWEWLPWRRSGQFPHSRTAAVRGFSAIQVTYSTGSDVQIFSAPGRVPRGRLSCC